MTRANSLRVIKQPTSHVSINTETTEDTSMDMTNHAHTGYDLRKDSQNTLDGGLRIKTKYYKGTTESFFHDPSDNILISPSEPQTPSPSHWPNI